MSLETKLVALASVGRHLVESGLVRGRGGNVSLRWQDMCYISPTGGQLDRLSAADFVPLAIEQENTWMAKRASSEYLMHLALYRARPGAGAVVHVHPPNCIALGAAGLSLKAITPDFYLAVGAEVPLLPYLTPTTQELANAVGELAVAHDAILLGNHGLILAAADARIALTHVLIVEEAARIVLLAHAATGNCSYLTQEQIDALERAMGHSRDG